MIPTRLRVELTHAAIQHVVAEEGARALHLKGPATAAALLRRDADDAPIPRGSTDADVLVEPRKAKQVFRRFQSLGGWRHVNSFTTGSPFGHAAAVWHDKLGYADLHRHFPGIGLRPEEAFDLLWADRTAVVLGNQLCWVPSVDHQRLLLLLHAARSGGAKAGDVRVAWHDASDDDRQRVRVLAGRFKAELPLAAAIGELDQWRHDRRHELWQQFSSSRSHSRSAEWRARIKAARSPLDAVTLTVRSFMVNPDWLATELGHRPSRTEIWVAWIRRMRRAIDENVKGEQRR